MTKQRIRAADPKRAVAYLRVSTDDQRLGVEAQRAAVEAWAAREGVQVASWHVDDGVSGAAPLPERKALLEALAALDGGAGWFLVAKRDRLARDVVSAGMICRLVEKSGARVLSADGTGNGDGPEAGLLRGIIDVFAEYERQIIRARTRAALAAKQARGELTGKAPFGYRRAADGIRLELDDQEQRVIARARELRAGGHKLREICSELGPVSRAGTPLSLQALHRIVRDISPRKRRQGHVSNQ